MFLTASTFFDSLIKKMISLFFEGQTVLFESKKTVYNKSLKGDMDVLNVAFRSVW